MELEIRVVDKNCSSTIFASSRVHGRMALIPIVFLDPNYNNIDSKQTYILIYYVVIYKMNRLY